MNWLDVNFWVFSPISIWVLGAAIFLNAYVVWKVMNKFLPIVPILKDIIPELERVTKDLRKDTVSLNLATSELDSNLQKLHVSIDEWIKILRTFWWIK